MTGTSVLLLGGARSGKSHYAEDIAGRSGLEKIYFATAQAFDDEMRERIDGHKARRGADWTNFDVPLDLATALEERTAAEKVILVDCLTLWLSNHLLNENDVESESLRLAECVTKLSGLTLFVSNEVGSGIVPDNALSRRFRDAQGRLNQMIAKACDSVVLVVAGLPLMLKGKQLL